MAFISQAVRPEVSVGAKSRPCSPLRRRHCMLQESHVRIRHNVRVVGIAAGVPCEAFAARAVRTRGSIVQTVCTYGRRNDVAEGTS
jgi:hypothetical protein